MAKFYIRSRSLTRAAYFSRLRAEMITIWPGHVFPSLELQNTLFFRNLPGAQSRTLSDILPSSSTFHKRQLLSSMTNRQNVQRWLFICPRFVVTPEVGVQ